MKNVLIQVLTSLLFFTLSTTLSAQWSGSTNTLGDINRDGDVGIGLTNPAAEYHIYRPYSVNPPNIRLSGSSSSAANTLHGVLEGSAGTGYLTEKIVFTQQNINPGGPPSGSIQFWTREPAAQGYSAQFKKRMTIGWNGYVGIGTDNPSRTLEVIGSARVSGSLYTDDPAYLNDRAKITGYAWVQATSTSADALYVRYGSAYNFRVTGSGQMTVAGESFLNDDTQIDGQTTILANGGNNRALVVQQGANRNFQVMGDGRVFSREVEVTLNNFPDYVFASDYDLMPLKKVKNYIDENQHLPNIPSAQEIAENGLGLGALAKMQMEKIEELTLYAIEADEKIEKLAEENEVLKTQMEEILNRLQALEKQK